ncbi:MAG TPA: hypothetical protein ENJ45_01325 [Phaeodactylibacter sp.]|nr:hypothetical protein [Phaeodactylibacter sp.]
MNLVDTKTGEKLKARIEKLTKSEVKRLKGNKKFTFDWSLEIESEVYKINLLEEDEILGLVSILDYPEEFRLHINLIESSKAYRGKRKSLDNIPGCLIAFVCQLSFERGYEGFVSLVPKTELIKYYLQRYGFEQMGNQMAVYYELSNFIIEKYLGNEKV